MSPRIAAEERQTNLIVALMATDHGITKQHIFGTVSGYWQRAESGTSSEALEKMFERDKEDLRKLGVPIETLGDFADPNDLREARYRIPKGEYDLPADISFTPAELAVLQLAGSVWSVGSMSEDAQAGVRKIRALGIDGDEPLIGFAPRVANFEPSFAALQEAIESGVEVHFDYLKPGEESPRRRQLTPLALVDYEARWHIFGIDSEIGEERIFLLSRIVGDVELTTRRFDTALQNRASDRAVAGLNEVASRNSAVLQITPGTEAALRLGRRGSESSAGVRVPYVDMYLLADELASYGPEVRVLEPAELRDAVIARLKAALAVHEGDA